MTEEQIRDGYDRLDAAVRPPHDALIRVEKRMRARRRHRRVGAVAGTAVAVAAVGGYAAASMGGTDDDGREGFVAVDPPPYSLVMTRPDGSTFEFEDLTISCDPPGTPPGETGSTDRSRIYLYSPISLEGEEITQPFVLMEAVVAKVKAPRTFTLPIESADGSSESLPMMLFMADTEGPEGNEVVSSSPSTGTLRVTEASCDPTPVLHLEVDANLASEEEGRDGERKPTLGLEGYVR